MANKILAEAEESALATITQAQALGLVSPDALSVPLPFESKIILFESVRVAGTTHTPNTHNTMGQISENAKFDLVREPENLGDPWAIRIEYRGKKIGYFPADRNEIPARLMDGGKTLRGELVSCERQGDWWKIFLEVSLVD